MNKKSILLTLLLIGGLITPQETKPVAILYAMFEFGQVMQMIINPCITMREAMYPSYAGDILTKQDVVKSYTTTITIYAKRTNRKATFSAKPIIIETFNETNPYIFLEKVNQFFSDYYGKRITATVETSITLKYKNRKYNLRKITKSYPTPEFFNREITKTVLIKSRYIPNTISNFILRFFFWPACFVSLS